MPLHGIILLSGDNDANQTAPSNGAPFEQVGSIFDGTPTTGSSGSCIHIRGKYLLTANHVNIRSKVSFDGVIFYKVDQDFAKIKIGAADMALIKLMEDPRLPDLTLNTNASRDNSSSTQTLLVGYGVGRNDSAATTPGTTWTWSNSLSTVAKRWGNNKVVGTIAESGANYSALVTRLDKSFIGSDQDEASLSDRDSGSALFQKIDEQWVLSGMSTAVEDYGTSTFNTFGSGDENYFVRISSYVNQINALLPDLSTYAGWVFDNALPADEDDPTDDIDRDGLSNFLEFAFGTDPRTWDADKAPRITQSGSSVWFSWQRNSVAGNLAFRVEETSDIANTAFGDSSFVPTQTGSGDGVTFWRIEADAPEPNARDGLRLEVESTAAL